MVLTSLQAQLLINRFNHIDTNEPFHMVVVNYVLSSFKENINPGDPTGIKIYLQATKERDKETNKLDLSV